MGADKADLRKEVDMNEHTDSVEDVAKQYKVNLDKGLSDSEVQEVTFFFFSVARYSSFTQFFRFSSWGAKISSILASLLICYETF